MRILYRRRGKKQFTAILDVTEIRIMVTQTEILRLHEDFFSIGESNIEDEKEERGEERERERRKNEREAKP